MKTKRMIALVLCAVMMLLALASCSDSAGINDYNWEPDVIVQLEFDLYIITESPSGEEATGAMKTVNSKINQYIDEKYNTTLNIHYLSAENYDGTISELVSGSKISSMSSSVISPAGRQNAGSIILINSDEMHDYLVAENKLVDLKPFLETKSFGTLNIQITSTLLEAAGVTDDNGSHLYCIPNDHPIGYYEYTVINREIAEGMLNFSAQTELLEMHILDGVANDEAQELINAVNENLALLGVSSANDVIRTEKGDYAEKARLESLGYICNVTKYPEATAEDAFSSAFGILKCEDIYYNGKLLISASDCETRAMEIIYAINADTTVRNLLQYGVENTHYILQGDNYVLPTENNAYFMNPLYTGDMFNMYYSENWTENMAQNGEKQNKESIVLKAE